MYIVSLHKVNYKLTQNEIFSHINLKPKKWLGLSIDGAHVISHYENQRDLYKILL